MEEDRERGINLIDCFKHASLCELLCCCLQKLYQAILSEVLPVANPLQNDQRCVH